MKKDIIDTLRETTQALKELFESHIDDYENLVSLVSGKIIIEASIGNWKANLRLKVNNILKLLKVPLD